jgi:hypothetical protein
MHRERVTTVTVGRSRPLNRLSAAEQMRSKMRRGLLLELVPALLLAGVWLKLVVASVFLSPAPYPEDRYVASATLAAILLLAWPLPLLAPGRAYAAAFAMNVLLSALALADIVHFRFF